MIVPVDMTFEFVSESLISTQASDKLETSVWTLLL